MQLANRKHLVLALTMGVALMAITGLVMAQGASQPVKGETQYFVTGEGDEAHLWVREGTDLRCVGHGACKAHDHDHDDHGHDDHGDDHKKDKK